MQDKCIDVTTSEQSSPVDGIMKQHTCNPCAFTVSYIFSKYEKYLSATLEGVYAQIAKKNT